MKFGSLLEATLQSKDVQQVFKSLKESTGQTGVMEITFHLNEYDFSNHRAKISLKISAAKNGKTVLDKTYHAEGNSQGGKMFWGGAMAMKNAIQQSSKNAMDMILQDFFTDLKAAK